MFLPMLSAGLLLASPAVPKNVPKFKADLTVLCDVTARSGAAKIKDVSDRAEKIADFLGAQSFGDDYLAFFNELSNQAPEQKPAYLLAAARGAGLGACAYAESSRKDLLREWQPECSAGDSSICDQLKEEKQLWENAKKAAPWPEQKGDK